MKRNNISIGNGIVCVFLIFISLTLTCFGVLAFLCANMNDKYADKRVDSVKSYYEADKKATTLLMKIDEAMYKKCQYEPFDMALEETAMEVGVTYTSFIEMGKIYYTVDIDDNKELAVELELPLNSYSDESIKDKFVITSWMVRTKSDDTKDDGFNLWTGEE